jgi:hypothetical protein
VKRCCNIIALLVLALHASTPSAAGPMSDDDVRQAVIAESIASYPGNCPCPYNTDRAGRRCGGRSAHSRAGGYTPTCYPSEVSPAQIRAYRARHGV